VKKRIKEEKRKRKEKIKRRKKKIIQKKKEKKILRLKWTLAKISRGKALLFLNNLNKKLTLKNGKKTKILMSWSTF
jgi:hypothetical protein